MCDPRRVRSGSLFCESRDRYWRRESDAAGMSGARGSPNGLRGTSAGDLTVSLLVLIFAGPSLILSTGLGRF
jgi:hypothetical protein